MDIKLFYREAGQGEYLILLHGNGEDSDYFVHQIEYFKKYYHVIAIDTRGHGKSERGSKPFTIRQFADDLYEFMIEHNIRKANLLGFSDGGNIAMIFAMNHSELVDHLILNGANLNGKGVKARFQIPIILGYKLCRASAKKNAKVLRNAELLALMVNDPNVSVSELSKIKNPTLVIAGTRDMIKTSHTRLIAKNIKQAKLAILQGDHFIANKESDQFNQVIHEFLSL